MNAQDILKYGHGTVLQSIDGFPAGEWETSGVCGSWSAKDVLAHLTSHELVLADVLTSLLGEGPTPSLDQFKNDQEFNDRQVETRRGNTWVKQLDEFNKSHTRVMALITRIPDETRMRAGTLPWYGVEYALDDFIVYGNYGHKREHSAQMAAFLDRLKR